MDQFDAVIIEGLRQRFDLASILLAIKCDRRSPGSELFALRIDILGAHVEALLCLGQSGLAP
jgi:hypothetical protein